MASAARVDGVTEELREGQRVVAASELPGVPAGTRGVIMVKLGLTWVRYRARFDNGVEIGSLHRSKLTPT